MRSSDPEAKARARKDRKNQREREARAARRAAGIIDRQYGKKKGDCTPDEWQAYLDKRKAYQAARLEMVRVDPSKYAERLASRRAADRARRQRINADPVLRAAYLAAKRRSRALSRADQPQHVRAQAAIVSRDKRKMLPAVPIPAVPPVFSSALFMSVWNLIPANEKAREDIASEAIVLLLSGQATDPAAAVKAGRAAHYRQFSKFGGPISIDQPRRDGRSWHDLLADGAA